MIGKFSELLGSVLRWSGNMSLKRLAIGGESCKAEFLFRRRDYERAKNKKDICQDIFFIFS
jgi:hypothetical protein